MPSQPDETPGQDLAHIIQYAQLASMLVCHARNYVLPTKRRVTLTIAEENELLGFLEEIEKRAKAAGAKLASSTTPVPNKYLAGDLPNKLLRYYDCVNCSKPHWEDERAIYDEHVGYRAKQGFRFGHRTELGLVK